LYLSQAREVLVTVSEAAAAVGRSRSTLYRCIERGQLKEWERPDPDGRLMLELEGLEDRLKRVVRVQANSRPKQGRAEPSSASDWWARVAVLANAGLDIPQWGPPPWTGLQWGSLAMVMTLAADEIDGESA